MSEFTAKDVEIDRDARHRLPPSLPASSASLLSLKHSPSTGFGVFATQPIPANTQLLASDGPAVYVIYRAFRKEVCTWCFRYERGRNWKFRFEAEDGPGIGSGGMVLCCEECRDKWKGRYGERGVEAYAAVEAFVQRQARSKGWANEAHGEDNVDVLSEEEIEEAWKIAEEQANLIRALRLGSHSSSPSGPEPSDSKSRPKPNFRPKFPSKSQKQALAQATTLPIIDTDTLFFLLSGVLCASSPQWSTLLTLNPSPAAVYSSTVALRQVTTAFLHLHAVLPSSLLPYVTRATLEAVLARDIGNSFGIWSTSTGSRDEVQEEDPEMLGYGIWPIASFFNHACSPNVARRHVGRRWVFASARNVPEGEELCISYIRGEENVLRLEERRGRLRDAWRFTCRCQKCLREEEEEGVDG